MQHEHHQLGFVPILRVFLRDHRKLEEKFN